MTCNTDKSVSVPVSVLLSYEEGIAEGRRRERESQKCCNYANFEPFTIAVHISNDRIQSEYWHGRAQGIFETIRIQKDIRQGFTLYEETYLSLADALKESCGMSADAVEDELNEPCCTLLSASLSRVNWREIAEEILEGAGITEEPKDA